MKIVHVRSRLLSEKLEKGFSTLEYAIGAVALITIVSLAVAAFGNSLGDYFNALSSWVQSQTNSVENVTP